VAGLGALDLHRFSGIFRLTLARESNIKTSVSVTVTVYYYSHSRRYRSVSFACCKVVLKLSWHFGVLAQLFNRVRASGEQQCLCRVCCVFVESVEVFCCALVQDSGSCLDFACSIDVSADDLRTAAESPDESRFEN
jgi:hypothetical protein